MDPALWNMLEEGSGQDEVAAIVRLRDPGVVPSGVRVVAQFGPIATVRLIREAIPETRADEATFSLKAPTLLAPEPQVLLSEEGEPPAEFIPDVDSRRPLDEDAPTGRGVVVGVVDWGLDFAHPDFRNEDGTTRLLALWDQQAPPGPGAPNRYEYGRIYTPEMINHALQLPDPYQALNYRPYESDSGRGSHGTHTTGIAAGNGRAGGPLGVAPQADLVFVHLATWGQKGMEHLGDSVTLLEAIDFINRTAGLRPWVINLSLGKEAGEHDGLSPVEQGLDAAVTAAPGRFICHSTGNYYDRRDHAFLQFRPGEVKSLNVELEKGDVLPQQVDIWYPGRDRLLVEVVAFGGESGPVALSEQASVRLAGREAIRIYHRQTDPNNLDNHIEIYIYPNTPPGEMEIRLTGEDVVDGRVHAWIERDALCPQCQPHFDPQDVDPTSTTGTICNGFHTVAVGAYNPHAADLELGTFSSSGRTRDGRQKPDLIAPGVYILAARSAPRGGTPGAPLLTRMSGTSMASPHVTGTVALMFQVSTRPLLVHETRSLLLTSTDPVDAPPETLLRIGSGRLNIDAAIQAVRKHSRVAATAAAQPLRKEAFARESEPGAGEQARDLRIGSIQEVSMSNSLQVNFREAQDDDESWVEPAGLAFEADEGLADLEAEDFAGGLSRLQFVQSEPETDTPEDAVEMEDTLDEEAETRYNFVLISGGPGPYDNRDVEHDQSWANYVTPPLLLTDTQAKRKAFVKKDEQVLWLVYKPAYERRWTEDSSSSTKARKTAVEQVKSKGFTSYVDLIEGRARQRGWKLSWLNEADDLWKKLKTLDTGSISRVWYWGHARDDLWLSVQHEPGTGIAVSPDQDEVIQVSAIDSTLKDRFRTGDIDRVNRFIGCNTKDFAEAWAKNYAVWAEGVQEKVNFASIHNTGGEPCLVGSAQVVYFSPGGKEDPAEARHARAVKCGTGESETLPEDAERFQMEDQLFREDDELQEEVLATPEAVEYFLSPGTTTVDLVELADEAVVNRRVSQAPASLLDEVLSRAGNSEVLALPGWRRAPSAAEIFDAFARPGHEALRNRLEQHFEVVALPRAPLAGELFPGDLMLRSLGGGLGHLAMLATGETFTQEDLPAFSITTESAHPGCYAEVIEAGAFPHRYDEHFARRLCDESGLLPHDTLILRIRLENFPAFRPYSPAREDLSESPGSPAPTLPPAPYNAMPLGLDFHEVDWRHPVRHTLGDFQRLVRLGKTFVILKASQGGPDHVFADHYPLARQASLLRGAYHFFTANPVADQVNLFVGLVRRLEPGDLPPSLDVEDGRLTLFNHYRYHHQFQDGHWEGTQAGTNRLLDDLQTWLDRVEAALGRTPIIYTGAMWRDDLRSTRMSNYPLWTIPGHFSTAHWSRAEILQYAEEGGNWLGQAHYTEPNVNFEGTQYDAYNGSIYALRGLADLGRPGVALSVTPPGLGINPVPYVAHSEIDSSLHLMTGPAWVDTNLSAGDLPGRGGDPLLLASPDALFMYFRSGNELIEATATRANNWRWNSDKVDALPAPVHDPRAILAGNRRLVVYWGDDDDWHLLIYDRGWTSSGGLLSRAKVRTAARGRSTGQPVVFMTTGVVHVIGRVDVEGHLFDLWFDGGTWRSDDITAQARRFVPDMPAATYSPCAYENSDGVAVAFRAVRGDIWVIRRSDNRPVNVTAAAHANKAAGHTTCFVLKDTPHIVYRGIDRLVYDLWLDSSGTWQVSQVCTAHMAADPVATSNGNIALIAVRADGGIIYTAQFDGRIWTCVPTTKARLLNQGSAPGDFPVGRGSPVAFRSGAREYIEAEGAVEAGEDTLVGPANEGLGEDTPKTFSPEDLAGDMAGLDFILVSVFTTGGGQSFAAGSTVRITAWDNTKETVEGKIGGSAVSISKEYLAPKAEMYRATYTSRVTQREEAIPLYVTDAAELRARIIDGKAKGKNQSNNYKQLNKQLLIEMQLNRLDSIIAAYTAHYNAIIGEPNGWAPLAPGWVKSMMVQESTAGSAGVYLVEVPSVPMKTRFNVLQAIDSWGPQQFLIIQEIEPESLKKGGFDKIMDDQRRLEQEWQTLDALKNRNTAQQDRLDELDRLKFSRPATRSSPTWSPFFREYPNIPISAGTTTTSASATTYWDFVVQFLSAGSPPRKYDYRFWIRTGIRWLFEKRKSTTNWSDAVRAYNGTGGRAEFYRAIVLNRARAAAAAAGIEELTWGGLYCRKGTKTIDGKFKLCEFERVANPCEPRC